MDLEAGLWEYQSRREEDGRQFALEFRNTELFLCLKRESWNIVPFGWAIRALEPDWKGSRGSSRQVRSVARRNGLREINNDDSMFPELWAAALNECIDVTTKYLKLEQHGFSKSHRGETRQADTCFFILSTQDRPALSPEELSSAVGIEGAEKQITTNRYQRDPKLRRAAIRANRTRNNGALRYVCCSVDFEERYGPHGHGFMHVHHLDPLGDRQKPQRVVAERDLVAVCPNCHAMIHRGGLRKPEEIRELLLKSCYLEG